MNINDPRYATLTQLRKCIESLGGYEKAITLLQQSRCDWENIEYNKDTLIDISIKPTPCPANSWRNFFFHHYNLSLEAEEILTSEKFERDCGELIRDYIIFKDPANNTIKTAKRKCEDFPLPLTEHACWLRIAISDFDIKEMGLEKIIVMHRPIKDRFGVKYNLSLDSTGRGNWLSVTKHAEDKIRGPKTGFLFLNEKWG